MGFGWLDVESGVLGLGSLNASDVVLGASVAAGVLVSAYLSSGAFTLCVELEQCRRKNMRGRESGLV